MSFFPQAALNSILKALRITEVNPESEKAALINIWDTTNIAATTHQRPGTNGFSMLGFDSFSLTGKLDDPDGTLTMTVWATNDEDLSAATWHNITLDGRRSDLGAPSDGSVVATSGSEEFALDFDNVNYAYIRVQVVATGATNTVVIKGRRKVR